MASEDTMITWDDSDSSSKKSALQQMSNNIDTYEGVAKASHYRDFLDIEPNRSVRPSFTKNDYYAFRSEEQVPARSKRIIKMCMDAYDKVGIIRNVIDLMGDFGCQGINIVHENKSVENIVYYWYNRWGKPRYERTKYEEPPYRSGLD